MSQSPAMDSIHDDKEKGNPVTQVDIAAEVESARSPFWLRVRKWIRLVRGEEMGIERIPEEMRTDQNPRDLGSTFCAANCTTSTFALAFLGTTVYGLGWWDSFLAIVFFNLLGGAGAAIVSAFGPKLGLRTMIIPRYSFGWWPAKVLAFLTAVNQVGWGIVNTIAGAAILYDAGRGQLPLTIAVLIIRASALILGSLEYRVLHICYRYCWIARM